MAIDRSHQGRRARGGLARTALSLVLIAALVGPQAGCSFLFVQRPPPEEGRRRGEVNCTTSNVAPVIDMLVAGFQIVRTGLALSATEAQYRGAAISRDEDITLGVSLTALFAASMIAGFGMTSDCREAMGEDSYPASRPGPRPGASSRPASRIGPPPSSQRKQEDQEEEAAVQARSAERARAEAAQAGAAAAAAAAASHVGPAPAAAPAAPQRNDTE
jgi:hypothetical protein